MKLSLIGLGGQTVSDHLPAIFQLAPDRVCISSIVEPHAQTRERYQKELGVPAFASVKEMLEFDIPHLAIVAVPHAAYPSIMEQLLKVNVNVLKEKPLAINLTEGKQIAALTKASNSQVVIACQKRFRQSNQMFESLKDQIGAIRFVQANYLIASHSRYGSWRGMRSTAGGGTLLDMGYHLIDLLIWHFGLPQKVGCTTSAPSAEAEVEDVTALWADYSNDNFLCSCLISDSAQKKSEYIEITGANGIIKIEKELLTVQNTRTSAHDAYSFKKRDCALAQLENFLAIVAGDAVNSFSPDEHLNHLAFIDAAYLSATTGIAQSPTTLFN